MAEETYDAILMRGVLIEIGNRKFGKK